MANYFNITEACDYDLVLEEIFLGFQAKQAHKEGFIGLDHSDNVLADILNA